MLQHFDAHPESPRMITFSRTFFLDVIVSALKETGHRKKKRKTETGLVQKYQVTRMNDRFLGDR